MGERTSHPPGTISWADLATSDQEGAKEFYGGMFGWEYEDMPAGEGVTYSMAKLRGRTVAAISPQQADERKQGIPPHWNVYVTVEDVDASARKVGEAGGQVLAGPFDVFDAGRMAVIADPAGAALCLWQPGTNIGAEFVNGPGAMTWADCATHRPRGGAGVLRRAVRLALRPDERGAAVLGDLQRRARPGRPHRAAARGAVELVPVLRRDRHRGDDADRRGVRRDAVRRPGRRPQRAASR